MRDHYRPSKGHWRKLYEAQYAHHDYTFDERTPRSCNTTIWALRGDLICAFVSGKLKLCTNSAKKYVVVYGDCHITKMTI